MANLCFNTIMVYCDNKDKESLKFLNTLFKHIDKNRKKYDNILSEIMTELTKDIEPAPSLKRAEIDYMSLMTSNSEVDDVASFLIEISSAYVPIISKFNQTIQLIIKHNNLNCDVKAVGIAEEISEDIYINTDIEEIFFMDRYKAVFEDSDHNNSETYFSYFQEMKEYALNMLEEHKYSFDKDILLNINNAEDFRREVHNVIWAEENLDLEFEDFICFEYEKVDEYTY